MAIHSADAASTSISIAIGNVHTFFLPCAADVTADVAGCVADAAGLSARTGFFRPADFFNAIRSS